MRDIYEYKLYMYFVKRIGYASACFVTKRYAAYKVSGLYCG